MRLLLCCVVLFVSVLSACKKTYPTTIVNNDTTIIVHTDTTIIQDTTLGSNQIRLRLPEIGIGDTSYQFTIDNANIQKFNIDYYSNVDSVIYGVYAYIQPGNTGTVELYDFTDSIPIPGSLIAAADDGGNSYYQSGNVVSALPHKEITLGLRLKSSLPGNYFNAIGGYLYLYRK